MLGTEYNLRVWSYAGGPCRGRTGGFSGGALSVTSGARRAVGAGGAAAVARVLVRTDVPFIYPVPVYTPIGSSRGSYHGESGVGAKEKRSTQIRWGGESSLRPPETSAAGWPCASALLAEARIACATKPSYLSARALYIAGVREHGQEGARKGGGNTGGE